jgi:hypothetical protein
MFELAIYWICSVIGVTEHESVMIAVGVAAGVPLGLLAYILAVNAIYLATFLIKEMFNEFLEGLGRFLNHVIWLAQKGVLWWALPGLFCAAMVLPVLYTVLEAHAVDAQELRTVRALMFVLGLAFVFVWFAVLAQIAKRGLRRETAARHDLDLPRLFVIGMLLLVCSISAHAESADVRELEAEHQECAVYFRIVAEASRISIGAGQGYEDAERLASDYRQDSEEMIKRAALLSGAESSAAFRARLQLFKQQQFEAMSNDIQNIAVLLERYGKFCKKLKENPAVRANEIASGHSCDREYHCGDRQ